MKETLIHALQTAGDIHLKYFHKKNTVRQKESISSIVTEADLESEQQIITIIERDHPQHNILSEELGFKNKSSAYTWIIDPLDGTSNYAAGLPWFGVLIALMRGSNPILSGAYLPVQKKLYIAEAGKGTTVNDNPVVMENRQMKETLVAFCMDYTQNDNEMQQALHLYTMLVHHARNIRCTNSLFDFMQVVEGKFGGCINMFTRIWDIVSPFLIISEAGGQFTALDFSRLTFNTGETGITQNYPVIAGNQQFLEELKDCLVSFK